MISKQRLPLWARGAMGLAFLALGGLLASVMLEPGTATLPAAVHANLPGLGVKNPVTGVLLGFRGYDTLLEVFVLWLAWLGQRQLAPTGLVEARMVRDPVLDGYASVLVPTMIVFAGYLVWVGADGPGGAFQAAAVLAGAGVLLVQARPGVLAGVRPELVRLVGTIGILTFVLVALWSLAESGEFLAYPEGAAKYRMLVIELSAAVALGWILLLLVTGGLRNAQGKPL